MRRSGRRRAPLPRRSAAIGGRWAAGVGHPARLPPRRRPRRHGNSQSARLALRLPGASTSGKRRGAGRDVAAQMHGSQHAARARRLRPLAGETGSGPCATTPGCRSISRSLKRTRALRSACWPSCWAREPDTGADAGEYIYSPVRLSRGRCIPVAQHRGSMSPPRPGGPCGATSSVPRPRPPWRPSATCPSPRGSCG
jgi:hypothetical protein